MLIKYILSAAICVALIGVFMRKIKGLIICLSLIILEMIFFSLFPATIVWIAGTLVLSVAGVAAGLNISWKCFAAYVAGIAAWPFILPILPMHFYFKRG